MLGDLIVKCQQRGVHDGDNTAGNIITNVGLFLLIQRSQPESLLVKASALAAAKWTSQPSAQDLVGLYHNLQKSQTTFNFGRKR